MITSRNILHVCVDPLVNEMKLWILDSTSPAIVAGLICLLLYVSSHTSPEQWNLPKSVPPLLFYMSHAEDELSQ
jgi:hypothetical protein